MNAQTKSIVVQKFGGTSVGTPEKIQRIADKVIERKRLGFQPIVVVSAMAGETDRLLRLGSLFSNNPREIDTLTATGEQVSASLMALAIANRGYKARSFLGHQIRILTNTVASDAQILKVETQALSHSLSQDEIPVVAGFQGVDGEGRITTLGRGGSDTTAVAIAAALGVGCEIYTDVSGVYSADPNVCPTARPFHCISYAQMLAMAEAGAKVLHHKSVRLAEANRVPITIRHAFKKERGSLVSAIEGIDSFLAVATNLATSTVSVIGSAIQTIPQFGDRVVSLLEKSGILFHDFSVLNRTLSLVMEPALSIRGTQVVHDGLGLGKIYIEREI